MTKTLLLSLITILTFTLASAQMSEKYLNTFPPIQTQQGDDKELTEKGGLKIFPNPATDYIAISDNSSVQNITIFNILGRQMKSFKAAKDKKYYVADLPNGMYLVQLVDSNQKIVKTQRLKIR